MFNCCKFKKNSENNEKNISIEIPDDSTIQYRTFENSILNCKVIEVYDGDTVTIITRLHETEPYAKYKLRLYGIDAPEMKPKKIIPNRELHIKCAKIVKEYVISLCQGKIFQIKFYNEEKFGRLMGDIIIDGEMLSQILINKGYVKKYSGDAKKEFTLEDLNKINKI